MKKSLYSVMLHDDIVRAVDRAAMRSGMTRSGMINRILAEHLGLATPETRQRDIFAELMRIMSGDDMFLINSDATDSLFAVKSALRFKYNPTIKYSLVVYPEDGEFFGELRAQLRTQNARLISGLDMFFAMWQRLEDAYFGERLSEFGGGKFVRRLRLPKNTRPEVLGASAAKYIRSLNRGVSAYFEAYPDIERAAAHVSQVYGEYINMNKDII